MTTTAHTRVNQHTEGIAFERAPRSLWSDARRRLLRNRAAVISLFYLGVLLVIAISAALLAPHNALQIFQGQTYRQAAWVTTSNAATTGTWEYPLGTDAVGRDVLSR